MCYACAVSSVSVSFNSANNSMQVSIFIFLFYLYLTVQRWRNWVLGVNNFSEVMWLIRSGDGIQNMSLTPKSESLVMRHCCCLSCLHKVSMPLFHLPRIAFPNISTCQNLIQGSVQRFMLWEIFPDFPLLEWCLHIEENLELGYQGNHCRVIVKPRPKSPWSCLQTSLIYHILS